MRIFGIEFSDTTWTLLKRVGLASATLIAAVLLLRTIPFLQRGVIHWAGRSARQTVNVTDSMIDRRRHVETLTAVTSSIARAAIWTIALISALGNLGFSIGPLLAGAGIAGVAVGFGAQSIVKDFFSGFFILLENQFDVGDTVTIAGITGTVERMTMRITVIRDVAGTAYFFPNSSISSVANRTDGWGTANVDIVFATQVPEDQVRTVLKSAADRATKALQQAILFSEHVRVEGPLDLNATGVTWRLSAKIRSALVGDAKRAEILALAEEVRKHGLSVENNAYVLRPPASA